MKTRFALITVSFLGACTMGLDSSDDVQPPDDVGSSRAAVFGVRDVELAGTTGPTGTFSGHTSVERADDAWGTYLTFRATDPAAPWAFAAWLNFHGAGLRSEELVPGATFSFASDEVIVAEEDSEEFGVTMLVCSGEHDGEWTFDGNPGEVTIEVGEAPAGEVAISYRGTFESGEEVSGSAVLQIPDGTWETTLPEEW